MYSSLNFGPFLHAVKLDEDFFKFLLEISDRAKINYTSQLAGKIKSEYLFNKEDTKSIEQRLQPYIEEYIWRLIYEHCSSFEDDPFETAYAELESVWINTQKRLEYNPPHIHTGHVSFVIYTKIPKEIIDEKLKTNGYKGGTITFLHSTNSSFDRSPNDISEYSTVYKIEKYLEPLVKKNYIPEEGVMFMFPAYLHHYVESFESDVERVSIAGNISFREKK